MAAKRAVAFDGFLVDEDTPAIWRGPIIMGVVRQFLEQEQQLGGLLTELRHTLTEANTLTGSKP